MSNLDRVLGPIPATRAGRLEAIREALTNGSVKEIGKAVEAPPGDMLAARRGRRAALNCQSATPSEDV